MFRNTRTGKYVLYVNHNTSGNGAPRRYETSAPDSLVPVIKNTVYYYGRGLRADDIVKNEITPKDHKKD